MVRLCDKQKGQLWINQAGSLDPCDLRATGIPPTDDVVSCSDDYYGNKY